MGVGEKIIDHGEKKKLCNIYNKLSGACTTEMRCTTVVREFFYAGDDDFICRREKSLLMQGNEAHDLLVYGGSGGV